MTSKLPETTRPSTIRTFLIADMRGWTRFTRELGDEAASRLATKFALIVSEAVEAWDGTVVELRGDEALCAFDSARQALRCAVELQEAFGDETRRAPELPLKVGVGLDAGEAVAVGEGYRGTALNLAARLCSMAEAGQVIATASLEHLAGHVAGLLITQLDPKPMKGFDEPVQAVLVASAAPHEHDGSEAETGPGVSTPLPPELDAIVPLIGRDAELRWVGWHWRRARHGHGGVIGLAGPPGIGCTRLAAELAAVAHADGADVAYLRGDDALVPPDSAALVVIDDLDALSARRARQLFAGLATGLDRRLVVAIEHVRERGGEPAAIGRLISVDRVRRLRPIDVGGVAEIGRLYLDEPDSDIPAQLLLEESDGIPAEVHRVASQWARAAASRKLGESARRTSRERRQLRAAESAMIDDVARLETARERSRLYVPLLEPSAEVTSSRAARSVCPYKGLAAFEATDADYFFGRERLIAELVARMVGSSFIGLIGASGSGKSSALQAGLLPALAGGVIPGSDEWIQVPMRPGEHPMAELDAALSRGFPEQGPADVDALSRLDHALASMKRATRLLLVVDQFEELFHVQDEAERGAFVDLLTESRAGMKVLVALRADHYERCAAYPRLAGLIGADQVLVGPLSPDEIRSVIRHPAERTGLRVEPELVEALVADVGSEPGGLPLLSTALLELWEARDNGRMTLAAYRATGGVRGAVARLAESVYARLDPRQQLAARTIFLRLTGEGESGAVVRRRVRLRELDIADRPEAAATLAALTSGRLVTASEGYVEVAHEALLREWPRLRAWIEEDSAGRQLQLHLIEAARIWDDGGREEGDLYRGARLASVLDWSAEHEDELNAAERAFVSASKSASEAEADRQRRTNRILRGALGVAAILLLVALGAGGFAAVQAQRADEERRTAEEQATLARARELYASSIAVLDENPELTIHLALEARALGVEPYPEALSALHEAVRAARTIRNVQLEVGEIQPVNLAVALSPDGRRLYTSPDLRSVVVHDVATGAVETTLGDPAPMTKPANSSLALSADESHAAVIDENAIVHVWHLGTGVERTYQAAGAEPDLVLFSPNGRLLATNSFLTDGTAVIEVWDLETGRRLREWTFDFMFSLVFHPDGDRILGTACPCADDPAVILLDIETGEHSVPVDDVEGIRDSSPTSAYFNPDASLLATAGNDGKFHLWDAATGDHIREFVGHTDPVWHIAFDPAAERVATTSVDGTTRVWDVGRGSEIFLLAGQGGTPGYASFSADGRTLATGSSNMTARVWDVSAPVLADIESHDMSAALASGEMSDDPQTTLRRVIDVKSQDRLIAMLARPCFGVCPGAAVTLDLDSGRTTVVAEGQFGAAVGLSPDGQMLWTQSAAEDGGPGGPIHAHDLSTGDAFELEGLCDNLPEYDSCIDPAQAKGFAVTDDGSQVIGVGFSLYGDPVAGFAWIAAWSADDGSLLTVQVLADEYFTPVLSSDGRTLAAAARDGVRLLDPVTLEEIERLDVIQPRRLAFSPDGSMLAAASSTSETTVFDLATKTPIHELRPSFDVDFTRDGTNLLTADADRVVRLWDLDTGAEIQAIPGAAEIARFIDDDRRFLTAAEGHVLVMTLDVDELFEIGTARLSREMTDVECEKYLGAPCRP